MKITQTLRRAVSRMNARQAANINLLQNFLDGPVPRARFDMNRWQDDGFGVNACGTRACAMGWACVIPALQAQGLRMREIRGDYRTYVAPCVGAAPGVRETAQILFGITSKEFDYLFRRNGAESGRNWDSPSEAADAIRTVMRRHGYEPTVVREPEFRAFMDKLTATLAAA